MCEHRSFHSGSLNIITHKIIKYLQFNESFIQNVHQSHIYGCSNLIKKIETEVIDKFINTASQGVHIYQKLS